MFSANIVLRQVSGKHLRTGCGMGRTKCGNRKAEWQYFTFRCHLYVDFPFPLLHLYQKVTAIGSLNKVGIINDITGMGSRNGVLHYILQMSLTDIPDSIGP